MGQQPESENDTAAGEILRQTPAGNEISAAYSALPPEEKKAVFAALRSGQDAPPAGLNDIAVTGLDTDGASRAARERQLMARATQMDVTSPTGIDNATVSNAREHWEKANLNADSAMKAVMTAIAREVLMPGAAMDYLANVDPRLVDEGRKQAKISDSGHLQLQGGVLRSDSPQDVERFRAWLDAKIPRDGLESTDDKRTALILKIALADASLETDNPHIQCTNAYSALLQMRVAMNMFAPGKNYGNAPDIANAEHFLETSFRVSAPITESNDGYAGIGHGPLSAPAWAVIAPAYGVLKGLGFFQGSKAGTQQTGWELAGIGHGLRVYAKTNL